MECRRGLMVTVKRFVGICWKSGEMKGELGGQEEYYLVSDIAEMT